MKKTNQMKNWQIQIGFWGTIVWIILISNLEIFSSYGVVITKSVIGYIMGLITALAGFMFWEIIHGRYEVIFGEEKGFFRIVSLVPLLLIALFGVYGFATEIFYTMTWQYNISFFVAGAVFKEGLLPLIRYIDNRLI